VLIVALLGLQGLVATFSLLVPVTTACAVLLGIAAVIGTGGKFAPATGSVSALLPNWGVGFLTYAAYNLFATTSMLIPFARLLPDDRAVRRGLGGGSGVLVLLAWSMIAALAARPDAGMQELPMSALAAQVHPALGIVYGILMGLGMFGAALSCASALSKQAELYWSALAGHRHVFLPMLALAAFALSLLGFGNLVGVVYPFFGYASIPLLICLVINWHRVRRAGSGETGR